MSIVGAGERAIHWPRGEFHGASLEHTDDLVLFVAPEPNLKWRTFATVMLDGLQHFGVQSVVCIGSIFGAVPHRGDVRMTGWANDDRLRVSLERHNVMFTNYEGPTGFVTVLLAEAEARGLPAVAVYGFAPNYIQGVPNPRVSHALLQTFSAITGVPLQLNELDRAGRALARQVDRLLQDQPQLREQVERMLSLMNVAEPPLEGLYGKLVPLQDGQFVRADDKYIRDSILLPASQIAAGYQPLMPTFQGHISEDELFQLIAYIKSIGNKEPERPR